MNWTVEIDLEMLRMWREANARADAKVTARQAAECQGLDYPARERRKVARFAKAA